jgi:hypothetical protein
MKWLTYSPIIHVYSINQLKKQIKISQIKISQKPRKNIDLEKVHMSIA